jgi:citronellol/citronellal dehydrogenase
MSLKNKTIFITGASRGIGLAIGLAAARQGANVVIAAKTTDPNPKLPGTIYTAAQEIIQAGGKALAVPCDIRYEDQIQAALDKTIQEFGGLDIVINNASAISLTTTPETSLKKYDLMNQVNGRGTWLVSKLALPYLKESAKKKRNPHILVLAPPPDLRTQWFENHVAYTMAKYAMSLCVIGLAGECKDFGIAVNALWPLTTIETSAMKNVIDTQGSAKSRTPEIMADAAMVILAQDAQKYTGQFAIDETVLRFQGVTQFDKYKTDPKCADEELTLDFFLPENPYSAIPPPKQILKSKL